MSYNYLFMAWYLFVVRSSIALRSNIFRGVILAVALALVFVMGGLAACASKPLDKAFAGRLDRVKETRIIVEYCQSCHVHRDFLPSDHILSVTGAYKEEPFRSARDCRSCHGIERNFWGDIVQTTRFPEGRIVGE